LTAVLALAATGCGGEEATFDGRDAFFVAHGVSLSLPGPEPTEAILGQILAEEFSFPASRLERLREALEELFSSAEPSISGNRVIWERLGLAAVASEEAAFSVACELRPPPEQIGPVLVGRVLANNVVPYEEIGRGLAPGWAASLVIRLGALEHALARFDPRLPTGDFEIGYCSDSGSFTVNVDYVPAENEDQHRFFYGIVKVPGRLEARTSPARRTLILGADRTADVSWTGTITATFGPAGGRARFAGSDVNRGTDVFMDECWDLAGRVTFRQSNVLTSTVGTATACPVDR
jgi:hypothetical protein